MSHFCIEIVPQCWWLSALITNNQQAIKWTTETQSLKLNIYAYTI